MLMTQTRKRRCRLDLALVPTNPEERLQVGDNTRNHEQINEQKIHNSNPRAIEREKTQFN